MTIAVIGLGSIGNRHACNLLQAGESVVGFDPDPDRRALFEKAGGQTQCERDVALDVAEAAIICSPNICHLPDLQAALERGCHALVEKPLSHTMTGLQDVLRMADSRSLIVAAAMNLRFHPVVQRVHEILSSGEMGTVIWGRFLYSGYLPSWRPHQDYRKGYTTAPVGGGVLFDLVHEIDLAQYLMGFGTVSACVARRSGVIETGAEDCADLIIMHPGGAQSSVHLDYVSKHSQRFFEIQCENGFIRGDLVKRSLIIIPSDEDSAAGEECFEGSFSDDYIAEMKGFLQAIRGEGGQICSSSDAAKILETVIKARKQAGLVST
ncbi:MAG: Gfo/Idh/MocA family oxidoreductase [Rhodospirillales bacterium]|nr:Gfo/Idh/MocA family oxidoreductase [Rhodospirillales bacterium]